MPDTDFTPALELLHEDRMLVAASGNLLAAAPERWLPDIGEVYNVTFTKAQRDALLRRIGHSR